MITDKDVKKLKNVFATKGDLEKFEKVFVTKDDAKAFATKADLEKTSDGIVKEIHTVIEMVSGINQKLDKDKRETDDILEHHERQIDRLNDKIFPTV